MGVLFYAAVAASLLGAVNADVYLHMPRGSNNRLNEKSANRNNGNRLFDSQNNNRGGYNVGDRNYDAFNPNDKSDGAAKSTDYYKGFPDGLDKDQYQNTYFEGSKLNFEWTAQHGCGGNEASMPHKNNCNMVLQFACHTDETLQTEPALQLRLKDGRNTDTPKKADTFAQALTTKIKQNDAGGFGRHESEAWYYECENRKRNKGLFTADQKMKGNKAIYTRQNPNGNRRGLECPEERDYYPYWHPTPFMDIAYLTSEPEDCESASGFNVKGNTMNSNDVYRCSYKGTDTPAVRNAFYVKAMEVMSKEECQVLIDAQEPVEWKGFTHNIGEPDCRQGDWSRVNHLGNGDKDAQPLTYAWTLPQVDRSLNGVGQYSKISDGVAKCIVRIRYNISTDDYDPRKTDASSNYNKKKGIVSPVTENPTVDVGAHLQGLRLAINTAQFGRTFQDRSHTFYIKERGAPLDGNANIVNLNVRGKRGNIVQTFPSVEYDFVPNNLEVNQGDWIHVQWTGSNTHNNGNPAGDGQAGDAGEGTGGTDRHNMMAIKDLSMNFPLTYDNPEFDASNFIKHMSCRDPFNGLKNLDWQDCAAILATSGQYLSLDNMKSNTVSDKSNQAADTFNPLLNDAPASLLNAGVLMQVTSKTSQSFHYMCTRNNNFSNRSQKATIKVEV